MMKDSVPLGVAVMVASVKFAVHALEGKKLSVALRVSDSTVK